MNTQEIIIDANTYYERVGNRSNEKEKYPSLFLIE